jgi:ParB family chromosome partitioning protein
MLGSSQYESELIGSFDDLNISEIFQSLSPLRSGSRFITELADSIRKVGLLSPIVVRITENGFEVVAGNRRFEACKSLGWKKIPSQIVELDDKHAFEVSIIENIQRHTLSIIEEGLAYKKYVNEFGWGAASDLARKLSKSSSYVSKRIRLLELPNDVLQLISESEISVALGEELLSVTEKDKQSKFAKIAVNHSLPSKKLRKMIKEEKSQKDDYLNDYLVYPSRNDDQLKFLKAFDKSIISLRIAMNKLALIIENVESNWILHEILMNHRNTMHSQIDLLIKEKKKFMSKNHFFTLVT